MEQEMQQELEKIEKQTKPGFPIPPLPQWPTSKPGPFVTPAPPDQRRMPSRTEQVVEIEYNQESGTHSKP